MSISLIRIFAIFIITFPSNLFAQNFVVYDCQEQKKKIEEYLQIFPECNVDDDCRYFDYGYPWQGDACNKAIISKSQEKKNLKYLSSIEEYNKNCIYDKPNELEKFEAFNSELIEKECSNLPRLFCLKGVCRNQYYPLIFDDVDSLR
ncbi:MAG: hypothetical protein SFT90_01240 [Rickettsiales bacterium]|nr:hypothetical protein [Rickettsiales bacterium]